MGQKNRRSRASIETVVDWNNALWSIFWGFWWSYFMSLLMESTRTPPPEYAAYYLTRENILLISPLFIALFIYHFLQQLFWLKDVKARKSVSSIILNHPGLFLTALFFSVGTYSMGTYLLEPSTPNTMMYYGIILTNLWVASNVFVVSYFEF